jgi:hypothetical protein
MVDGGYVDFYIVCTLDWIAYCNLRLADYGIRGKRQLERIPEPANAAALLERQAPSLSRCGARSRVFARAHTAAGRAWRPQGACD